MLNPSQDTLLNIFGKLILSPTSPKCLETKKPPRGGYFGIILSITIDYHSFIICMPRDTLNANKTNCPSDIPMKNGMIELALIGSKLKIV